MGYVCFDNEHLAFTTTLRLRHHFPDNADQGPNDSDGKGLTGLLPTSVSAFGLIEEACTREKLGVPT